ncbi:MAG: RHS repeat-associated core domain-containing protein, partial [Acidobacteriota bacterium]
DGQGQTVSRYAEAPFGEDMTTAGNQDYFGLRFTGHERDYHNVGVLDDLDNMHARHYTPYVGRFLQIDQVLGSPASPQSWNRYAYAANDPVNFYDPDGREVRVQSHRVWGPFSHASILLKPDNPANWADHPAFARGYATIGADSGGLYLVSGVNRKTDVDLTTKKSKPVTLGGMGDDVAIAALLSLDASYGANLRYSVFPPAGLGGYNSNSYVAGLLGALGLRMPDLDSNLRGSEKPVPANAFGAYTKAAITIGVVDTTVVSYSDGLGNYSISSKNYFGVTSITFETPNGYKTTFTPAQLRAEARMNAWLNDIVGFYNSIDSSLYLGGGGGSLGGDPCGWDGCAY